MSRPVHFEIEADDPERMSEFYRNAFGWKVEKWDGPIEYWLVTTGDEKEMGINGGFSRRSGSPTGTTNTIGVESLDDSVNKVLAAGGTLVFPKHAIPGMGWLAYCKDTEGNPFGIMQPDDDAK